MITSVLIFSAQLLASAMIDNLFQRSHRINLRQKAVPSARSQVTLITLLLSRLNTGQARAVYYIVSPAVTLLMLIVLIIKLFSPAVHSIFCGFSVFTK